MNLTELKSLYEEPLGEFRDTICERVERWSMAVWREPSVKGAEFLANLGLVLSNRIEGLLESEKQQLQSIDRIRLEVIFLVEYEQRGNLIKDDLSLYCVREKRMEEYRAIFGWKNLFSLTCPLKSLQPSGLEQFLRLYRSGKLQDKVIPWENEEFLGSLKLAQTEARSFLGLRKSFPPLVQSFLDGIEDEAIRTGLSGISFPFLEEEELGGGECSSHLEARHRALFDSVEQSLEEGFNAVHQSLYDLHSQLVTKVRDCAQSQLSALTRRSVSLSMLEIFEDDVRKIERSLSAFRNHAHNLTHIRLTITRATVLVSKEGPLESLLQSRRAEEKFYPISAPNANFLEARPIALHGGLSREMVPFRESRENRDFLVRIPEEGINRIPNATCFVFYLPPSVSNESLRRLFSPHGTVMNAYVAIDKVTNRPKGFGFVDYSTPAEASAAVLAMDKYPIDGKFLSVSIKI